METAAFDYELPPPAIAQSAIEPRHAARLLRTRDRTDHLVWNLPELLDPGDLLVVNRTMVRRARLIGVKETGGKIELLLVQRLGDRTWEALARPSRRLREGQQLRFGPIAATVSAPPVDGRVSIELEVPGKDIETAIASVGQLPLPPYFHGRLDDDDRYQTIFASHVGSAAAPTAGLHFTDELVARLRARDVRIAAVDLQVGLDTFRPMTTDTIDDHAMHRESFVVPPEAAAAVSAARSRGRRVVAVGTTVVRALETVAGRADNGAVEAGGGETDLFIRPGHRFRAVDAVLTNFHAPRSTLLVLVAAFLGSTWREIYDLALARGYRFLSFGDAMLIEPERNT